MISNPATLALAAWLLPALSFLVLAIVYPLRRLGKPAAWFSTLCAAVAVVSLLSTPQVREWQRGRRLDGLEREARAFIRHP